MIAPKSPVNIKSPRRKIPVETIVHIKSFVHIVNRLNSPATIYRIGHKMTQVITKLYASNPGGQPLLNSLVQY